jgi:putative endonuclease
MKYFNKKWNKSSRETGQYWEEKAMEYLSSLRFVILEKNWLGKHGEIDIIAKKNDLMVFIEVKYRKSSIFAAPEEAVTKKKRQSIIRTANAYLSELEKAYESRFDIISFVGNESLNHIEGAFYE